MSKETLLSVLSGWHIKHVDISQGIAETRFRCGAIFNDWCDSAVPCQTFLV